jgi:O-Antigen ligase
MRPPAFSRGADVRRVVEAASWVIAIIGFAIALSSVAISPSTTSIVRVGLAGFCALAIWRPDAALLVTTALLGFGIILSHMGGVPTLRVTELLVVSSLAGCCVRALPRASSLRQALTGSISVAVVLFAIAALASALVWQRVHRIESGMAYLPALRDFLLRDYFIQPGDFWQLVSTAVLIEGLALYAAVAAICRSDRAFFDRALRMLIVGGAGLGVLSVVRLVEIVLRNPAAIDVLRATPAGLRISPQIPDYIASGSYFALCWLALLGVAIASRRRLAWIAGGVPLMAALYLTGSRSVIVAAVVGLVAMLAVLLHQRSTALRGVIASAIVATLIMAISYRWMIGRDLAGEMARQSLTVRFELIRAGLGVFATRPLFGVGLDRFYLLAGALASPELRTLWGGRMNPHNDFLRIGAELGAIGLGLFLWILIAAARRIWRALEGTRDVRLAGLAGGLTAFLVTSLVSNPLMVRDVSYAFWIALGLAVGHASRLDARSHAADELVSPSTSALDASKWRHAIPLFMVALLVLSIPFRARQELATLDPSRVSYGLSDWTVDADGTRYRLSGTRSTIFVTGRAQLVDIPMRTVTNAAQEVEIRIDGRLANRVTVGLAWQRVRMPLPSGPPIESHRIDLAAIASGEVDAAGDDQRTIGVKVGEIQIVRMESR